MSGDDGGSWEQAIVAGRGVCRVWVPDDEHGTRTCAAMGGLISRHKVAAILGRPGARGDDDRPRQPPEPGGSVGGST